MKISFGKKLKELRLKNSLTQENLADFLGVSFQTISKWEREDNYPDITILPEIAKFFKVSVDSLLGINEAETKEEINRIIEEIDNHSDSDLKHKAVKNAVKKYPSDFRIQLRLMSDLCFRKNGTDYAENHSKILSIYNNIQQNCTANDIRICSKRYMAAYYNTLSHYDGSGIVFEDVEKMLEDMPHMRDGKEFLASYLYPFDHPDRIHHTQEAVEEELSLFYHGLSHYCDFKGTTQTNEFKTDMLKKIINLFETFYDDGNYGYCWQYIIYDYGYLGEICFQQGNTEDALKYLKKAAELAAEFDNLDRITVMKSKLFNGRKFDKHTLGTTYSAKSRLKKLMTVSYPLSDEFKTSEEFLEIIEMLK